MLVLLENDCPIPADVRPRDRLLVRLRAFRLDRDLAAGASPDATVPLALRAQTLVAMPARGVAQARALLADGASPIYHRASRDDLRARLLAAAEALSPA